MNAMNTLRIRVYNVRFGDAILISIPDKDETDQPKMRHILMDVGNVGKGGTEALFEPIINDILNVLNGDPLDLYIMTHEHMDHVEGVPHADLKLKKPITANHAWLTTFAQPKLNKALTAHLRPSQSAYREMKGFLEASGMNTAFVGFMVANNDPATRAGKVEYLRTFAKTPPAYLHGTSDITDTHPFREAKFTLWGPAKDIHKAFVGLKPLTFSATPLKAAERRIVEGTWTPPAGVDGSAFFNLLKKRQSPIGGNLLAVNSNLNNTSLVFLLEWRGWRLLFPGDAEVESWERMKKAGVVEPVHFLKVSHHASGNGTPDDILDKLFPDKSRKAGDGKSRYAVISTAPEVYNNVPNGLICLSLEERADCYTTESVVEGGYIDFLFEEHRDTAEVVLSEKAPAPKTLTVMPAALRLTSPILKPDEKNHIVNLAFDGTFLKSGFVATTPADVDAIFTNLALQPNPHLMLHFHGGLVDEHMGLGTARRMRTDLASDPTIYPLFFLWESGLADSVRNLLRELEIDQVFRQLLSHFSDMVAKKTRITPFGRGIMMDAPGMNGTIIDTTISPKDEEELLKAMRRDKILQLALEDVARTANGLPSRSKGLVNTTTSSRLLKPGVVHTLQAISTANRKSLFGLPDFVTSLAVPIIRILKRVFSRITGGTAHGFPATVTEEVLRELYVDNIVTPIWNQMKRSAERAFADNTGLSGEALHGGTYFLERLANYLKTHKKARVSLVGHSAGAIYVCRMLKKVRTSTILPATFKFDQIIFFAPGVDFELFNAEVVTPTARFKRFRMFGLGDPLEVNDEMLPGLRFVYQASLLYFVSGVLEGDTEKPLVGMERFYNPQSPHNGAALTASRTFVLDATDRRIVWSPAETGDAGFLCDAKKHGDFNSNTLTLQSAKFWLK